MLDLNKIIVEIKKNLSRRNILLISILVLSFLATRLINLDKFPIFSDEGIYIRWAKVAWHDASWRFISLTDGKQPLQTWGTIPFLKLFPDNALLAGRLFAVAAGFVALVGVFTLLSYLFDLRTAIIGSFLYIFTPYFLFYNRMALVDSGVEAGFIWILLFSIILARTRRFDASLILGLISGMALLAKSSVRMFVGLAGLAPILFAEKKIKRFLSNLLSFSFLYLIVIVLAVVIYNIQRLSPFFHYVSEKNKTFIITFDEFLKSPFAFFFHNLRTIPSYVISESGFFIPVAGLVGLILLFRKDKRLCIYLTLWLILPYLAVSLVSKVLFPRYIIFFASLLLIFTSYLIAIQKNIKVFVLLIVLYIASVAYFDYTIIHDHANVPFPEIDRGQYLEGWTAGWGTREIIEYAREKAKEKPVIILAEGNFGMAGDVLDVFLKRNDQISIRGFWPLDEKELYNHQKELESSFVYVVFPHKFEYPRNWPIKLIKRFDKPGNKSVIYFYELIK
jgi:4-amino-4-deoxy-L-arabinose transferase-like glycosyltransferase